MSQAGPPTPEAEALAAEVAEAPVVASTWGGIWRLAWPLVITMMVNAVVGLLDTWIAGKIGPGAQAAVGLTMQLILLINAATTAVSVGAQALVSRFVGAENWPEAGRASQQAVLLGVLLTVVILPPVWLAAPLFFDAMGAPVAVRETGTWYLRLLLIGLLPMDVGIVLAAIMRARGRMTALLALTTAEAGVWIALSLMLGLWGGWGLEGLATGFVLGKFASLVVGLLIWRRMRLYAAIDTPWRVNMAWFRRILSVGLPAGIQVLIRNMGMMAYYGILSRLAHPTEAVAAFTIGFRVESIAFMPVFALNIATATIVGQNLGAGKPDEAERATWRVVGAASLALGAFGLVFWVFADQLAGGFTTDPIVRVHAADYLRVMAISEPFLAVVMVLNGALQGAGDARAPMVAVMVFQIVLRLPLAYVLALPLGYGAVGVWWAMTLTMAGQALGTAWYFRRGLWRTRVI